jgi:hypothetical protein
VAYYADNLPPGVSLNDVAREPLLTLNQELAGEYAHLAGVLRSVRFSVLTLRAVDNPNDEVIQAMTMISDAADMLRLRAVKLAATVAAPDAEDDFEQARRTR